MSNKLIQIINEEISAIRKDKDKEIFNYKSITNDAWNDKVRDAKDFQDINFDLENNESTGEKKTFYVKKNLRKDQPIKYEFNAELFYAGGDWEIPILYFRLEFTHDYSIIRSDEDKKKKPEFVWDKKTDYSGLYHCFVIIPPNEAGNKLKKNNDGSYRAYDNNEVSVEEDKKIRITDADKRNCWKWLETLLEKLVNDRHKMLD